MRRLTVLFFAFSFIMGLCHCGPQGIRFTKLTEESATEPAMPTLPTPTPPPPVVLKSIEPREIIFPSTETLVLEGENFTSDSKIVFDYKGSLTEVSPSTHSSARLTFGIDATSGVHIGETLISVKDGDDNVSDALTFFAKGSKLEISVNSDAADWTNGLTGLPGGRYEVTIDDVSYPCDSVDVCENKAAQYRYRVGLWSYRYTNFGWNAQFQNDNGDLFDFYDEERGASFADAYAAFTNYKDRKIAVELSKDDTLRVWFNDRFNSNNADNSGVLHFFIQRIDEN